MASTAEWSWTAAQCALDAAEDDDAAELLSTCKRLLSTRGVPVFIECLACDLMARYTSIFERISCYLEHGLAACQRPSEIPSQEVPILRKHFEFLIANCEEKKEVALRRERQTVLDHTTPSAQDGLVPEDSSVHEKLEEELWWLGGISVQTDWLSDRFVNTTATEYPNFTDDVAGAAATYEDWLSLDLAHNKAIRRILWSAYEHGKSPSEPDLALLSDSASKSGIAEQFFAQVCSQDPTQKNDVPGTNMLPYEVTTPLEDYIHNLDVKLGKLSLYHEIPKAMLEEEFVWSLSRKLGLNSNKPPRLEAIEERDEALRRVQILEAGIQRRDLEMLNHKQGLVTIKQPEASRITASDLASTTFGRIRVFCEDKVSKQRGPLTKQGLSTQGSTQDVTSAGSHNESAAPAPSASEHTANIRRVLEQQRLLQEQPTTSAILNSTTPARTQADTDDASEASCSLSHGNTAGPSRSKRGNASNGSRHDENGEPDTPTPTPRYLQPTQSSRRKTRDSANVEPSLRRGV